MTVNPTLLGTIRNTGDIGIKNALFNNNKLDISAQGVNPRSMFIGDNGTKLFVLFSTTIISRYDLSEAWDVTSGTFNQSLDLSLDDNLPEGLTFKPDGTKLIFTGQQNDDIYEVPLSIAFDLSTAGTTVDKPLAVGIKPAGVSFSNDGLKIFMINTTDDTINEWALSTAFDVSTISLNPDTTTSLDIANTNPRDLRFSDDGSRFYITDSVGNIIYEYDTRDPFDITTITQTGIFNSTLTGVIGLFKTPGTFRFYLTDDTIPATVVQLNVITAPDIYNEGILDSQSFAGDNPRGLAFALDGFAFTHVKNSTEGIVTRPLSTRWDVTSAGSEIAIILAETTNLFSVKFDVTGNRMYALSRGDDTIYQYDTSTKFSVAGGVTFTTKSLNVSGTSANPTDVELSRDGKLLFVLDDVAETIYQFDLSTPFDISTGTDSGILLNMTTNTTAPSQMHIDPSGYRLFVTDIVATQNSEILQFTIKDTLRISSAVLDHTVTDPDLGGLVDDITGIFIGNNNSELFVTGSFNEVIVEYTINSDVGISDVVVYEDFKQKDLAGIDTAPLSVRYSPDGMNVYFAGNSSDAIIQIKLSHPYSVTSSTGSPISLAVNAQDATPTGIELSNDGTKMYMVGNDTNTVYQYDLTTPFDLSNFTLSINTLISPDASPQGFTISNDGFKAYLIGAATDTIYQFTFTTAFDLSTASQTGTLGISGQDTAPRDIVLSRNGNQLMMIGSATTTIYRYDFDTPFDISTLSFTFGNSFSIAGFDINPRGVDVSQDNKHLIIVGTDSDNITEFNLN